LKSLLIRDNVDLVSSLVVFLKDSFQDALGEPQQLMEILDANIIKSTAREIFKKALNPD